MTTISCPGSVKALLFATAGLLASSAAHAQAVGGSPAGHTGDEATVQEIVVTALKRETNIQDTPLAISAATGETLAAMGVTDSASLSRISPGLIITESSFSGSRLTVRNIRAAGEATVGLYYDDTPVVGSPGVNADAGGTTPALRMFDIDRAEVLRGPQGTLYGSSSMAGAVRLIFAKPRLDGFEAAVNGQAYGVSHGDLGYTTQGMVNIPLVADKLAVRAVGFYEDKPGYIDNFVLNKSNYNEQKTGGGRVIVRAQPIDGLTIDGLAVYQKTDGSLNDYFLANGPYRTHYEELQPLKDELQLYSGTVNWDLGPVALTAVASHSRRYFNYSYDFSDFFRVNGARFPVGSANYIAYNAQAPAVANSPQTTTVDTAEVRLGSTGHGPLQWTTGLFYSTRKGDFDSNILRADPLTGAIRPVGPTTLLGQRVITDGLKQTAIYGEATYDLTDRLSITGGVRYFDYERHATNVVTVVDALVGIVASAPIDGRTKENGFLYKANVSYKFADHVMGYATASNGERPGGVNQVLGLPADLQSFASDSLWNYEAGLKSELFDRRLVFNVDVFQIDWKDMQTSGTLPGTNFSFITNAARARIQGVEAEATFYPIDGLQLQASGSYIDAKLTENQANQTLLASGLKGDPIPYVPKATLQASAQYGWSVASDLKATLRYDLYYSSESWTAFRHTDAFQQKLPAYTTQSVRATLSRKDDWSASVFVNNLADSDAVVNKLSNNAYGGLNNVRGISLTPRTIGVDLTKHF